MTTLTRRDFLKVGALGCAGVAALAMGACAGEEKPAETAGATTQTTTSSTGTGTVGTTTASSVEEIVESTTEAAKAMGAYSFAEWNIPEQVIDTTRKSTYNTDERLPVIKHIVSQELKTWAPWGASQGRYTGAFCSVFEKLYWTVDSTKIEPCLAKEMKEIDDTHLQVTIYDYIVDTDGNNLTAEDVVVAYDTFIASGNAQNMKPYVSCRAVDTYTVEFEWAAKLTGVADLPALMATPLYTIKANESHDLGTDPCGTGPYKLESQVPGSGYVLVANEDYWQTDKSLLSRYSHRNVDRIEVELVKDSSMQYITFEEGDRVAVRLNTQTLGDFQPGGKHEGEFPMAFLMKASCNGIGFNATENSPLSDINLRLACAYAIDTQSIVAALGSSLYYCKYTEGGSSAAGYNVEWEKEETYYNTYDLALAKEYLKKSNYKDETLVFLSESNDEQRALASQIVKQQLEELGLKIDLVFYELASFNEYQADFEYWDFLFYVNTGNYMAKLWKGLFDINSYKTGRTRTGILDDKLQTMIEELNTVEGNTQEKINEFRNYILENCWTLDMYGAIWTYALDPRVASIAGEDQENFYLGSFNYYLD